jgi:L-rhamnose mutarotase
MEHILYKQILKPGCKEEYVRRHSKCWPSLLTTIRKSGIKRELIWLDGDNIYIYMMAPDIGAALRKLTNTSAFKKWNGEMSAMLSLIQGYSENREVDSLPKVFDLESQLAAALKRSI